MLIRSPTDAFLVPIPQYPLYSATLCLYGGQLVPYELDEDAGGRTAALSKGPPWTHAASRLQLDPNFCMMQAAAQPYAQTSARFCLQALLLLCCLCAGWGLNMEHLSAQLTAARAQGLCVRGMVVINPGNPTGQCLSKANQQDVVRFAEANNMIIIADEVYQVGVSAESC